MIKDLFKSLLSSFPKEFFIFFAIGFCIFLFLISKVVLSNIVVLGGFLVAIILLGLIAFMVYSVLLKNKLKQEHQFSLVIFPIIFILFFANSVKSVEIEEPKYLDNLEQQDLDKLSLDIQSHLDAKFNEFNTRLKTVEENSKEQLERTDEGYNTLAIILPIIVSNILVLIGIILYIRNK